MHNLIIRYGPALAAWCAVAPTQAWHFETRFVERVGNVDVILPGNAIDASNGDARSIRFQVGVFDDASSEAPAGGFAGWVGGGASLTVSGSVGNSDERRNPGRLAPFNANQNPNANGNPPLPGGDPFTVLTNLDVALNGQTIPWFCGADGQPLPRPEAIVRGRNTFVSIYAFSIDPNPGAVSYTVTASGFLYAVNRWVNIPSTQEPDCSDPDNPLPGHADYGPIVEQPQNVVTVLNVMVPGPSAGVGVAVMGVWAVGRRRR
ncbi:MAG: hypothetical protein AB7G11_15385 [Phycisphaerales bacterium]